MPTKPLKNSKQDQKTLNFIEGKKKLFKENKYRQQFDQLAEEIDVNLINTRVQKGDKIDETQSFQNYMLVTKLPNGSYDYSSMPVRKTAMMGNPSNVPQSQEAIAFSKILIAVSALVSKLPDGHTESADKAWARASYELWKQTWTDPLAGGLNTLQLAAQDVFTYGWGAWRTYNREICVKRNGVTKYLFDSIFREPLDPTRTWLSVGATNADPFSKMEVYYEIDITVDAYKKLVAQYNKNYKTEKIAFTGSDTAMVKVDTQSKGESVTQEALHENPQKIDTHVTLSFYENPLDDRIIVVCGQQVLVDTQLTSDDCFGSIVVARCFARKSVKNPYAVGLYELMRGNTAKYSYIDSLNAQQIEAEISPILFGVQTGNGEMTFRRGSNIINPKQPGSTIDVVRTSGNVQYGIQYADKQKQVIEQNTGINDVVAGNATESTLGGTEILKEAALNRLIIPRCQLVDAIEFDFLLTVSLIKQYYTVPKALEFDEERFVEEFVAQNPGYFVQRDPSEEDATETQAHEDGESVDVETTEDTEQESNAYGIPEPVVNKKIKVIASPYVNVGFDFNDQNQIQEMPNPVKISRVGLMDNLDIRIPVRIHIDPNSMLKPSEEIRKQTMISLDPLLNNNITQIFGASKEDPQLGRSLLMKLQVLMDINKLNIFDFIPKEDYDAIMSLQLAAQPTHMPMMMAPDGTMIPKGDAASMMPDGSNPIQTQNAGEIPQIPNQMSNSMNASIGKLK